MNAHDKTTWYLLGQFVFCLVCFALPLLFPVSVSGKRRRK